MTRVWRRIRGKKAADTDLEKTLVGMRHDIIEIVRYGWLEMTYGLVGFFGVYYILFWFCLNSMGVQMPFAYMFGAYTVGRLLTAVGITPGGLGVIEAGTAAVLVGWGAGPRPSDRGVVLFSLYTHFFEVPLGVLGWGLWWVSPKKIPSDAVYDEDEDSSMPALGAGQARGAPRTPARTDLARRLDWATLAARRGSGTTVDAGVAGSSA